MTTYAEIWKILCSINVNDHIEKKMNLSYLSWAWAWGTLMEHYPQATFMFHVPERHDDGTVTVYCTVDIDGCKRTMWLPVMDHNNKAVQNPDARKISDSKMRCLVKTLALFGLGHYIYAGEDVPPDIVHTKADPMDRENLEITDEMDADADALVGLLDDPEGLDKLWAHIKSRGEKYTRGVWSLLDSEQRSTINAIVKRAA